MTMEMVKKSFTIEFITEMLGTVPKNPNIYTEYIESKKPESLDDEDESLTVEFNPEKGWTGFHSDEKGLFIYDYMMRGFLKNAGNLMKDSMKMKAVRSKIDNYVFVFPRKIYLGKMEPSGVLERSIRVMVAQGPRTAIIKSDFINEGTRISFDLIILPNKEITMDIIDSLMVYGQFCGLGQFRNGSYGRFIVVGDPE